MNTSSHPSSGSSPAAGLDTTRDRLWDALLEGDEYAAVQAARSALDAGLAAEALLLDVLAPVQRRIGDAWAGNRITVAQEHTATNISDRVVAALALHFAGRRGLGDRSGRTADRRLTVACVSGEWHALPARLLAEVLKLRGRQVDFLGAHVPTPHLISHLHRTGADAVALSASLAVRLPTVHTTVNACRSAGVPVLAGGAAFGRDGRYAGMLGALWADDARGAAGLLEGDLPRPDPAAVGQPADELPHLEDQEYTLVTRSAAQLVQHTLGALEDRVPAMKTYTERQRQYTAEDVAYIVDFLATALYVDDAALFTDFLSWTADVLAVRDVAPDVLFPALDVIGGQLKDFPRATGVLNRAEETLTAHLDGTPPGP
ncbi:cobalamin-binding protein [Streptomyces sp. Ru73]|uniref:cobalamin B12-binding domain-containing protein n=1 Tax=Streptomyces sp. Ru73 TaxID=2080748 RepID=UPI000CDD4AD2|nr:B12-binding domain-containing protein [Streptomyces sp. Ru73]POX43297.1 cobalamin-binding protein [Streptomyces sp. Ru73]